MKAVSHFGHQEVYNELSIYVDWINFLKNGFDWLRKSGSPETSKICSFSFSLPKGGRDCRFVFRSLKYSNRSWFWFRICKISKTPFLFVRLVKFAFRKCFFCFLIKYMSTNFYFSKQHKWMTSLFNYFWWNLWKVVFTELLSPESGNLKDLWFLLLSSQKENSCGFVFQPLKCRNHILLFIPNL